MADSGLLARAAEWMDRFFDPETGLLAYPSTRKTRGHPYERPGVPVVRESAGYALALLGRDAPGDRERAALVLDRVIAHQIDDPRSAAHGTFRRSPLEPAPGPSPREWIDYDPNWREFVGCTLVLALERFADRVPDAWVTRVESALRLAAQGTRARAVPASYSNVALMRAFLLDWAGARLGVAEWSRAGADVAAEVAADYRRLGAFEEHNSPTYYGVDLFGLAMWREHAPSASLRALGRELEAELWRDLARFYHAGLRNLCGPYSRAYGMDMTGYVAGLGVWMLPIAGAGAPLPALGDAVEHGHDFFTLAWVGLLGARPPDDVVPGLLSFRGERRVEQVIRETPRRVATAWLGEHVMLGGEHTASRWVHPQHHPATLHWRRPDGGVGWLRLVTNAPADAVASRARLEIAVRTGVSLLRSDEVAVWLERTPGLTAEVAPGGRWRLPGLELSVQVQPSAEPERADGHRLGWRFAPGTAPERVSLRLQVVASPRDGG